MKGVQATLSQTLGRTRQSKEGRAGRLTVGDFAIANPVFATSDYNMLSLGFLARFVVTFDFPHRTMYLKKGRRFDGPDRWDRSGLHLIRTAGKTIIHSVDKDSPAAAGGLRAEDVVVRVADRQAEQATLFQLRNLLCRADKEVRLAVQRGDQQIQTTLVLGPPGGR
jgi:hypothetical protein